MVDFELEDELNQILRSNLNLLIIESLSLSPHWLSTIEKTKNGKVMQKEPISTSIKSQASEYKRENYSDECYVVHTRKKKRYRIENLFEL